MEANFYLRSFQVGKDEDLFSSLQEAKHINVDWRKETHTTSVDIHVTRSSLIGFNKLNLLNVYSHDSFFSNLASQKKILTRKKYDKTVETSCDVSVKSQNPERIHSDSIMA